jgi:single-strand DNA-binding protein
MNRVTLIGFIGQDARTSATKTGKEITRFSVATNRRYQQGSEWKEKTYWHDCVVYGGYAQFAAKLGKGAHVVVEGELIHSDYSRTIETEAGSVTVKWPVTEIVVESIIRLDRKRKDADPSEGAA